MRTIYRAEDFLNKRFARLVAVEDLGVIDGNRMFRCRCDCGREKVTYAYQIRRLATKSCGCLRSDITRSRVTIHGMAKPGRVTKTFRSWVSARRRCFEPTSKDYMRWGGRGITMCSGWKSSFLNFLSDMGEIPDGLTLDRKDFNGHYSCGHCDECRRNNWPMNCRWATDIQQSNNRRNNRRITFNGEVHTAAEWSRITGIPAPSICRRIDTGWSVERALTVKLIHSKTSRSCTSWEQRLFCAALYKRDRGVCSVCGVDCVAVRESFLRIINRNGGFSNPLSQNLLRIISIARKAGWPTWRKNWWDGDHIIPQLNKGETDLQNGRTVCFRCHMKITAERTKLRYAVLRGGSFKN